jgi:hypothetical protein
MKLKGDLATQSICLDDATPVPFQNFGDHALLSLKDNVRMFDFLKHLRLLSDGQLNVVVNDRDACVDYALLRLKIGRSK